MFHIANLERLVEVSRKVPSCNNLKEDDRDSLLVKFSNHLRNARIDDLHLFFPSEQPQDGRSHIDFTDLLAATIETHLGQHLRTCVCTNILHTDANSAAQTLDDIAHIHSIGGSHILTFQLDSATHTISHSLSTALPKELHCKRLITLLRLILTSISTGQHSQALRKLLHDVAVTPLDTQILDLGLGYARSHTRGVVCALSDSAIIAAENAVRTFADNIGCKVLHCETTYLSTDDDLAFLLSDLAKTSSFPNSSSHRGHADKILYVGKDGSRVSTHQGRIIVNSPHELHKVSVPCNLIERIVMEGNVSLTAGARSWALRNNVPIIFLSSRGSYLGHLSHAGTLHAQRLICQLETVQNPEKSLSIASAIVRAKLRNQIHVLHRLGRRTPHSDVGSACRKIRTLLGETSDATCNSHLLGIEGAASEIYFATVPTLLPSETRFRGRSRRPPRDLANAALSYGYAILLSECVGALLSSGLEPSLGILHAVTDKRPSLALDLMEEFRPLLVDSTVFALLRAKRLRPEHAYKNQESGAVLLNSEGKKILTTAYEETLQRSVRGALRGFAGSWRRHITHEAQLLARAILEPSFQWVGVVWR